MSHFWHKPLEGLIFDVDGTLLDSRDVIVYSLVDTARQLLNLELDPDELDWVMGSPGAVTLKKLGYHDPQHGIRQWYENYANHEEKLGFYDGMEEVLVRLRQRYGRMGVVTNNLRFKYKLMENRFDLDRFFDPAICVDDIARPKPYPDPMLEVCRQWSISPRKAVYIGDSENDLHSAHSAGAEFICAGWGAYDRAFFQKKGVPILETPEELLHLLP
ncbi:HAD family hydrolase [Desulfurispirillum indicum]|uniref:HAD-superfamily hydrolase, subfamily IA, variant 1 n=1 Tax=Desulfurispirillum indicum (strain ATCC BAA-1389 / DSM 22839 / S5) TaxID=653733 RepID=E6W5E0_DESIS|nr:HAD family hydrolase [Desulfurispirillum indicum]ADU64871.1 HAD-superfamily hydrolase, subfamily IA, variant 1 [Desulfurispirillum indicum S5]UCZ56802.1 HAD family hydrolase [Desulfurispirillum indicum]